MSAGPSVSLIRTTEGFARLGPEWWDLWRRAPAATPFQCPAWLLNWWRAFAPGKLMVFAARRNGRLVGLAPFYLEDGALGRRLLPVGISLSDYLDALLDPACGREAGEAIAEHALRVAPRWDAWEWTELAEGAAALALPCPRDCGEDAEAVSACPTLVVPEGARDLRDAIPPAQHRKLRMAQHRAARRGSVEIAPADDPSAFLALLARLHRAAWAARGEPGVMADARVMRFHASALPELLAAGLARTAVLRIAGEPVAAYYGLRHRDRAYGYLTGFDPAYGFESPGTLIAARAIEEALREGAREFHFLRGREAYKYRWGAQDRWNRRRVWRRVAAHADAF